MYVGRVINTSGHNLQQDDIFKGKNVKENENLLTGLLGVDYSHKWSDASLDTFKTTLAKHKQLYSREQSCTGQKVDEMA